MYAFGSGDACGTDLKIPTPHDLIFGTRELTRSDNLYMFKNRVVLAALYFVWTQLISACAFSASDSPTDLPYSLKRAIAVELANASAIHWEGKSGAVYVDSPSHDDWLREALTDELVSRRYAVSADPSTARQIEVAVTNVRPDSVYVSLNLDNDRALDRMFHFERVDPSDVAFHIDQSSDTLKGYFPVRQEVQSPISGRTTPPLAEVSGTASQETVIALPRVRQSPQKLASTLECGTVVLTQGSLKQNLKRILNACDWELVEWPQDRSKPNHELDWFVPTTQSLDIASIEGLAKALRIAFDLEINLNRASKTLSIRLRK